MDFIVDIVKSNGFVGSSVSAYKYVYPLVSDAILNGEVEVTYIDYDGDIHKADIKPVKKVNKMNVNRIFKRRPLKYGL